MLQACKDGDIHEVERILTSQGMQYHNTHHLPLPLPFFLHLSPLLTSTNPLTSPTSLFFTPLYCIGSKMIEERSRKGDTALHVAARNGHVQLVHLLIKFGSPIDPYNSYVERREV